MARPTVEIEDPAKPGDYQVIALEDYNPDTMSRYVHEKSTPRVATPVAPAPEAPPAPAIPAARETIPELPPAPPAIPEPETDRPLSPREIEIREAVEGLLAMTVADQGPAVARHEDQEILERLREVEKRKSALSIINARLRALRAKLFR